MSFKSLLLFKRRFLLLFLFALLLSIVSAVYFARYLAKPNAGLVVNFPEVIERDGRIVFAPKTPFSPAVSAGLRPDADQVVAIAGRSIRGIRDVVEADARIRSFHPFAIEVLRDGRTSLILTITPVFTLSRPDWIFALLFCVALGFMAFYLIFQLPEDTASNLIALAALFYLVFTAVKPFYYENLFSNLLIHFGKLTSWLMVFFALYFPTVKVRRAGRLAIILGVLAVYLAFIAVRLVFFARWAAGQGDLWFQRYRFLGKLNNISDGVAFLLYAALLAVSWVKTAHLQERRQLEWILAGFIIGVPPYFFLDQLPIILGEPPGLRISMGSFANLFLIFVPLFFIVGLLKYRTFNLSFFILRYLVYVLLALIIFAFFTALYEPVQQFIMHGYGLPLRMAGFLVTALLFLFLVPVRGLLSRVLEKLLFRSRYDPTVLEQRNMELRLLIDELNRQKLRSFHSDRIEDLRAILGGIASRVNIPAGEISGSLTALEKKIPHLLQSVQSSGPSASSGLPHLERELRHLLATAQRGNLQIRDFARKLTGLAGTRSGVPASVSPTFLARNALIELKKRWPDAPTRLEAGSQSKILCHPEELLQAILYLMENALESGSLAGEEVVVRTQDQEGYVRISVEDRGMGIEASHQKRIFGPFFTTKPGHDGLGLYFSRAIAERNSGSIEIYSRPGAGTCASLLFPQVGREGRAVAGAGG